MTPAEAQLVAAAPRLAEVHAPGALFAWREQLAALRPDVRFSSRFPLFD